MQLGPSTITVFLSKSSYRWLSIRLPEHQRVISGGSSSWTCCIETWDLNSRPWCEGASLQPKTKTLKPRLGTLVLHSLKQRTWKWNQTATFLAQGLPPPKPWLRPHTPITCNSCGLLGYLHQYYPNCSRIGAKNELMGSNSLRIIVWPQMLWESPLWSLRSRHQSNSVERIQEPEGRSQTPRW